MVLVYKCTTCGGEMTLDEGKKQLICEHCGNSVNMFQAELCEREVIENVNIRDAWRDDTIELGCPSCGSRIYAQKNAITATCRYCETQMIIQEQIEEDLCPDKFIAFRVTEEEAMIKIRQHMDMLAADVDLSDGKLEGMYVPFWLYDFVGEAHITGIGKRDGSQYMAKREGEIRLNKVPLDASLKMPNKLIDKILPYEYAELYDFQTGALAGFSADKYDLRYDEMQGRLYENINDFTNDLLRQKMRESLRELSTVHKYRPGDYYDFFANYDEMEEQSYSASTYMSDAYYALLPVWYFTFEREGNKYRVMVNGQTGKVATDFKMTVQRKARNIAGMVKSTLGIFAIYMFFGALTWFTDKDVENKKKLGFTGFIIAMVILAVMLIGFEVSCALGAKKIVKQYEYDSRTRKYLDWDGFKVTGATDSRIR